MLPDRTPEVVHAAGAIIEPSEVPPESYHHTTCKPFYVESTVVSVDTSEEDGNQNLLCFP
jgi:hypothetical protein